MYIFIDESGINKQTDHSSFVLVYVTVNNYAEISRKIEAIEKSLDISSFHWSEAALPIKQKFAKEAVCLDFEVKIAIVKNPINPAIEMERILPHLIIEHNIKKIFIDGKKPKWYERKIKKILRDKTIAIKKLKTVDDKNEAGVRLADMIAGMARWYFNDNKIDKIGKYYEKLEKDKKIVIILR
jgi:hypothetical protein